MNATLDMLRLLSGYWFVQALHVVAELSIADLLAAGPRRVEDLAETAGADADALYRLLRGLSSSGVFDEVEPGTFALTPLAETLRADREHSLRPVALMGGHPLHWQAWGNLLLAVRTGETAFDAAHGTSFFDALETHPSLGRTFQQILARLEAVDAAVLANMDLTRFARIVDVGGGAGAFARRIARACPDSSVVFFDREDVIRTAEVGAGTEAVAGDFFEGVPPGADAYVLKFVIHDWEADRAEKILRRCREAMDPAATLFVVEAVMPEGAVPSIAKTHDVNMLVLTGGRERTRAEYASLLRRSGFALERVVPATGEVSILEARPV